MRCTPRRALRWLATGLFVAAGTLAAGASGPVRIPDLDGRLVDPFHVAPGVRAVVLLFTGIDCPVSNRYAPEIRRLHDTFAAAGVRFWLVYANPAEAPEAIRAHMAAFAYPMAALRDPRHDLVRAVEATVTPEAAVLDATGRLVYRGRIDDRYVDLGVDRQVPTRRDLRDALAAVLAGAPVREPITRAVGCLLADLRR